MYGLATHHLSPQLIQQYGGNYSHGEEYGHKLFYITDWFIRMRNGQGPVSFPETPKEWGDTILAGWLLPTNNDRENQYVETENLTGYVLDWGDDMRGYWVATSKAYFWLRNPKQQPSCRDPSGVGGGPARTQLGLFFNHRLIKDLFFALMEKGKSMSKTDFEKSTITSMLPLLNSENPDAAVRAETQILNNIVPNSNLIQHAIDAHLCEHRYCPFINSIRSLGVLDQRQVGTEADLEAWALDMENQLGQELWGGPEIVYVGSSDDEEGFMALSEAEESDADATANHFDMIYTLWKDGKPQDLVKYAQTNDFVMGESGHEVDLDLAIFLLDIEDGSFIDIEATVQCLQSQRGIQETTVFLRAALKENKAEQANLQTLLLKITLTSDTPQDADAIMLQGKLTHYDRVQIGELCEKNSMWQRAAEHYTEIEDITRVLVKMRPEIIVGFFAKSKLDGEQTTSLLQGMMELTPLSVQVCVELAKKYHDKLQLAELVKDFNGAKESLYVFLGAIVDGSEDPRVHFEYIKMSCELHKFKEASRFCHESDVYDPQEVKDYLKDAEFPNVAPFMFVCHKYNFVGEMTEYLYLNNFKDAIKNYLNIVKEKSPHPSQRTTSVLNKLIVLDDGGEFTQEILKEFGTVCPVEDLVKTAETCNHLHLLKPWIDELVENGSTESSIHNVQGKIRIALDRHDPESAWVKSFLLENSFYTPRVLGLYCEKYGLLQLAFTAYKHGAGACDDELIRISHSLRSHRDIAEYVVARADPELLGKVLNKEEGRPDLINPDLINEIVVAISDARECDNKLVAAVAKECFGGCDRTLYTNVANHCISSGKYKEAVQAATKARSLTTWNAVESACMGAGMYGYVASCWSQKSFLFVTQELAFLAQPDPFRRRE